jgi:hypothetical protein
MCPPESYYVLRGGGMELYIAVDDTNEKATLSPTLGIREKTTWQ